MSRPRVGHHEINATGTDMGWNGKGSIMRAAQVKQLIIDAVLQERERCAKIAEEVGAYDNFPRNDKVYACDVIVRKIRGVSAPSVRFIRPETAEKHPELLAKGAMVAGQGLSADGERIIGNGRGSERIHAPLGDISI